MHIGVLCDSYLLCAMFCVTSTFMLSVKRFVIPQNKKGKCESRFIFVLFLCIFNFDFDEVKKTERTNSIETAMLAKKHTAFVLYLFKLLIE